MLFLACSYNERNARSGGCVCVAESLLLMQYTSAGGRPRLRQLGGRPRLRQLGSLFRSSMRGCLRLQHGYTVLIVVIII